MSAVTPALSVRGVAKSYGPVVALRDANVTIQPGEVHALLGANGAGKSTLVKILAGVIPSDAGQVRVAGEMARFARPRDARSHGIATVFQDPALVPDLTVADNLRLTQTDSKTVSRWLGHLDVSKVDPNDLVRRLPLATQRLLDLARALADEPSILMLDEITATLPADMSERVFELMAEQRDAGRSVVFITHRLGEVLDHCDQATVLRDGRDVDAFAPTEGGEDRMVQAMMGEAIDTSVDRSGPAKEFGDVRLEVRHVSLRDRVHDVSFEIRGGEILGIAALEGQGQDALFELLAGARKPDDGQVLIDGRAIKARHHFDAIKRGVVLVPDDRSTALLPQRSVSENLASTLYNTPRRWAPIKRQAERQRVHSAIERLSIDTRAQSQVSRLSGGNQQKVTIGRWLTAGFRTLLCFDPTRGIDVGTKQQIYELLRELASDGTAIVLYTSELKEIAMVCDRVLVVYGGRVVRVLDASDADERSLLAAAHGLERPEVSP
jgi:ribose transport system ATP-binding protein